MSFVEDIAELVAASLHPLHACHQDWERRPLGVVAKVINGYPFASGQFNRESGWPLARIRDVVPGRSETFYAGETPDGFWLGDGDLLVGMDGDFNTGIWKGGKALLNQRVCKVVPDASQILPNFLFYLLPGYLKLINDHTSSTTVKHLSSRTLAAIPLPVPPLETQRRIVARIDELFAELDDGDAALVRARDDLETYRKSLLKAAVTGELTADWRAENPVQETGEQLLLSILANRKAHWEAEPKNRGKRYKEPLTADLSEVPPLPENWVWASLEQMTVGAANAISDGPFGSNLKSEHYSSSGPRVVRLQNIGKDGDFVDARASITDEHYATLERHHVIGGDLVVAILGDPLPRAVVLPDDFGPGLVKADCIKVRVADKLHRFLAWAWLNGAIAHSLVADSVKGVGRPRISMAKIKTMPIPLPPRHEQVIILDRLVECLDAFRDLGDRIATQAKIVPLSKQAILSAAFRGELVQ